MKFKKVTVIIVVIFTILTVYGVKTNWFLKQLYPKKFSQQVYFYSNQYGVDPYLVFAMIKAESNFNPDIVSSKGAIGLMQVIPETGIWVANYIGIENFNVNMLYNPDYNINIGTWYLKYLLKQFNNNITLAVAAYNGGSGNVSNWLKDKRYSENGSNLKKVPFSETDKYIKKVTKYYKIYKSLYK
ncbi:lytic transglycosylase domain-containing protein [Thermoanaerobacterium thermosaccharolyticum]|uniref:lytic transglycosylase domain-containing protein n=1 Tax=Thermoanaerobacterium thermosaccharolyticum TaxID=1517 RepID=UPI0027A45566|nr:soluble lytic murein transglycosylase [Thermoanaerobacterium sp.]WHE07822.1 lytic transglycosylase domain-containing protein [Thermoanaerobacterium thermosaccharolyticum]